MPRGQIIQKEQRFGALDDEIVYAHGDQVDADRIVDAGAEGEFQFGADAIGRGDEQGVFEAGRTQIEQSAKAA